MRYGNNREYKSEGDCTDKNHPARPLYPLDKAVIWKRLVDFGNDSFTKQDRCDV